MKLRSIELRQVRKFTGAVTVRDLGDGVNLVIGANEAGKSTLLAGLRAALFARHTSRAAEVRDLRHHRNETAPEVGLTFDDAEGRWRIEKRFIQGARARLVGPAGVTMEGDAAEIALRRRLGRGAEAATGLWNLLLVGQGEALDAAVAEDARATLQASLEAALGADETGVSAQALLARIEARLRDLVHAGHGAPSRRWRAVRDELLAATTELEEVGRRLDENAADLDTLESALSEHDALVRGFDEDAADATVAAEDRRLRERVALGEAEAALGDAERALERRRALIAALGAAAERMERSLAAVAEATETLRLLEADGQAAREMFEQAETALAAAEQRLVALRELRGLVGERERLVASLEAEAAELVLDLTPAGLDEIRLDGRAAPAGRLRIRLTDPLTVELGAYGRLQVKPAADRIERLRTSLESVRTRLDERLRVAWPGHGAADLDPAAITERQGALERARRTAEEQCEAARQRLIDAKAAWQGEQGRLHDRRAATALAEEEHRQRARELAIARTAESDEALEREVAARRRARIEVGAQAPAEPSEANASDLRAALATHRARRHELEREIERRRARIDARTADGLRERLAALEQKRARLAAEDGAMEREVAVLRLLRKTLIDAEAEIRDRYLEPLLQRLQPYLELLLPGIEVGVDENLEVVGVTRHGVDEPFSQLSHGTREQIAVAVRLAFAEVLIDDGHPCFVVLDDALVFSDDDRLERMFQILARAGGKVQVLVLTCRERAFAGLPATRRRIESREEASTAVA